MENNLWIKGHMAVMRNAPPVSFVHHRSIDKPGNHVLHLNNYIEIYFFIEGRHRYIVENSLYELSRGDAVVINPREVHKALPVCEAEYERFYFLVDPRAFDGMAQNPLADILKKPSGKDNLISFPPAVREDVIETLYKISDCYREKKEDLRAFGHFLHVLDEIGKCLRNGQAQNGTPASTPKLLESILCYISENTATINSITEIANYLGLTPQYLSSYFSKHIGTPLKTYVQAKKIALAKDLLDKGSDVTEACFGCGFNDCSYFIRIFKRYVGVTPLIYKNNKEK
ncbi:MAG: helix-turn-helix domain-containing protein [Clostridia bacterium]|nr:helix-turn-helix domain-containing protein [Clostridia bacterium]